MFGINGGEMIILIVIALIVIGPKRLPEYAEKLRDFVRSARRMAEGAKTHVKEDFGDDFKDVDWRKLDPRQYDPRRIVKEALAEEDDVIRENRASDSAPAKPDTTDTALAASPLERHAAQMKLRGEKAPFDEEAT